MSRTRTIEEIYAAAQGEWTGADWGHEVRVDGRDRAGEWCAGEGVCQTCASAAEDAAEAERLAAEAMAALRTAVELASQAAAIEREWGYAPTWGPLARAMSLAMSGKE